MKDINKILKISKHLFVVFTVMLGFIYIAGCTDEGYDSVYNSDLIGPDVPKPVVDSYSPADFAYSGVSEVTITGQNLTPSTKVYFTNGVEAPLLSAASNELTILAPVFEFDDTTSELSVSFKIHTTSEFPSDSVKNYKLRPAAIKIPKAITRKSNRFWNFVVNANNEIIVEESDAAGNSPKFVKIVDENEPYLDYAAGATQRYASLKYGPDGTLYGVRRVRAIFQIPEGAGASHTVYTTIGSGSFSAIEFDKDGNMWLGTTANDIIYMIDANKTVTEYPVVGEVKSLRTYDGADGYHLYISLERDGAQLIVRAPLAGGVIGAEETYYDFSANFEESYRLVNFNFTDDGTLFLATTGAEPIWAVALGGSAEVFYPALLAGTVYNPTLESFGWGINDELYYVRKVVGEEENTYDIIRVSTQKQTAPYYGRD